MIIRQINFAWNLGVDQWSKDCYFVFILIPQIHFPDVGAIGKVLSIFLKMMDAGNNQKITHE